MSFENAVNGEGEDETIECISKPPMKSEGRDGVGMETKQVLHEEVHIKEEISDEDDIIEITEANKSRIPCEISDEDDIVEVTEVNGSRQIPRKILDESNITVNKPRISCEISDDGDIVEVTEVSKSKIPWDFALRQLTKTDLPRPVIKPKVIKNYKCLTCGEFQSFYRYNIIRHMKVHGHKLVGCAKCNFEGLQVDDVSQHLRSTHLQRKRQVLVCERCHYTTNNKTVLEKHKLTHAPKETHFSCGNCDYQAVSITSLKKHMRNHADKLYVCKKCDFSDSEFKVFSQHPCCIPAKVSTKAITKCKVCSKGLTPNNLERHMKRHDPDGFSCDWCNFKTKYFSNLQRHLSHHRVCEICSYRSTNKNDFEKHKKTHIKVQMDCFVCDECGCGTADRALFEKHMKTHENPEMVTTD